MKTLLYFDCGSVTGGVALLGALPVAAEEHNPDSIVRLD